MGKEFFDRARPVWAVMLHVLIGAAAVGCVGWLILRSVTVLIMLALALGLALMLNPLVEQMSRVVRRWLAIMLVYTTIVGLLIIIGILLIPRLVKQGTEFADSIPHLKSSALAWWGAHVPDKIDHMLSQQMTELKAAASGAVQKIVETAVSAISWTARGVIILVMSIYLLVDKDLFVRWFRRMAPPSSQARLQMMYNDVVGVMGAYLRGLVIMILFVGICVTITLGCFHIKYWLFIGVMAGILEVIPYFGAVTGAIPAVILGFQKGPHVGIILIVIFILINQVEGHVVAPLAMGHSMHMRPLAVLLSLLIGAEVSGIQGMIVAVPLVGIIRVVWVHASRYLKHSLPDDSLSILNATGQALPHQ